MESIGRSAYCTKCRMCVCVNGKFTQMVVKTENGFYCIECAQKYCDARWSVNVSTMLIEGKPVLNVYTVGSRLEIEDH